MKLIICVIAVYNFMSVMGFGRREKWCPSGQELKNGTCVDCPDGKFRHRFFFFDMKCKSCRGRCNMARVTNQICDKKRGICLCKGNYDSGSGCRTCIGGYGFNDAGQCTPCPDGYYRKTWNSNSDKCKPCPKCPMPCLKDSGVCPCVETVNDRECRTCVVRYYLNDASKRCEKCTSAAQCNICPPGTSFFPPTHKCDKCPEHYWSPGDSSLTATEYCRYCSCDNHGSIKKSWCDKKTGKCSCKRKYRGRYCNHCAAGYRKQKNGKCE